MSSGTPQVAYASAAALAIVEGNDLAAENVLLPAARWYYPEADDTPFLASHLLGIVAWDRRGWAARAGDTGAVTFYGEDAPPVTPGAPDCSAATVTPLEGEVPLTVALDASGCSDPDGDNLSFSWTIEGTEYTVATSDHTFDEPGNYLVQLTVTDDAAAPSDTTVDFTVVVNPTGGTGGTGGDGEGGSGDGGTGGTAGGGETGGTGATGGAAGAAGTAGIAGGTSGYGGYGAYGGLGGTGGAAATTGGAPRDDSGCGCVVVANPANGRSGLLAALFAVALLFARRRRR
jgi:MYXO-CTERM domain-containing protein